MKLLLVRTLIGVFAFQGLLLLIAAYKCDSHAECPELGQRVETLFGIATATLLSLLSKEK
jgi:hypothetical protein